MKRREDRALPGLSPGEAKHATVVESGSPLPRSTPANMPVGSKPTCLAKILVAGLSMNLCLLVLFLLPIGLQAQSSFVNLDFEATTVPVYTTVYPPLVLPASQAFPGWTVWENNAVVENVGYNILYGPEQHTTLQANAYWPPNALGGNFAVCFTPVNVVCALSQSGMVPADARSFRFRTVGSWDAQEFSVSFGGQTLVPLVLWADDYGTRHDFGADISLYAGQTGELRFTSVAGQTYLDDITFSPNPVPEPGVWVLLGLGALALGHRRLGCSQPSPRDPDSEPGATRVERSGQALP